MRVKRMVITLIGLLFTAGWLFSGCGTEQQTTLVDDVAPAVPVIVAEAYHGNVEVHSNFTGTIEPEIAVKVVHKTGGKVSGVNIRSGDKVSAGDALISLDAAEISAQVAQAEATLQVVQVQLEAAVDALEDTRILYEEDIISRQQFEEAQTRCRVLEAQVAQAQATLQLARTQLAQTLITAPIGGIISELTVNPGEMISPGIPVMTINKLDVVEVHAGLTEKDVVRVTAGQKVDVEISALGEALWEGEVAAISPVADPRTKTYQIKVALPNENGLLKSGMTATVRLVVAEEKDTVVIPAEAVLTQQNRPVVYVVEGGLARQRPVTLGLEGGTAVSVLTGVETGEQVVVRGQHYLQEAGRVIVVEGGAGQ